SGLRQRPGDRTALPGPPAARIWPPATNGSSDGTDDRLQLCVPNAGRRPIPPSPPPPGVAPAGPTPAGAHGVHRAAQTTANICEFRAAASRNRQRASGLSGARSRRPHMLTINLVDRLLASRIVPREAKLAAIESWRRELASMRGSQDCRRLERRLAAASRVLAAPRPWAALGQYLSGVLAPARPEPLGYPRQ